MKQISLFGPNYRDFIFEVPHEFAIDVSNFGTWNVRFGGIFNVHRTLNSLFTGEVEITAARDVIQSIAQNDGSFRTQAVLVPEDFLVNTTLILDKFSSTRTALVDSSKIPIEVRKVPGFRHSGLLHISYLDSLKIPSNLQHEIKSRFELIIGDLSNTKLTPELLNQIGMVDILLCSSSEYEAILNANKHLDGNLKLPDFLCIHDPEFLLTIDRGSHSLIEQKRFDTVDTIGAGDAFAAFFLDSLASGASFQESAVRANSEARASLKETRTDPNE